MTIWRVLGVNSISPTKLWSWSEEAEVAVRSELAMRTFNLFMSIIAGEVGVGSDEILISKDPILTETVESWNPILLLITVELTV